MRGAMQKIIKCKGFYMVKIHFSTIGFSFKRNPFYRLLCLFFPISWRLSLKFYYLFIFFSLWFLAGSTCRAIFLPISAFFANNFLWYICVYFLPHFLWTVHQF